MRWRTFVALSLCNDFSGHFRPAEPIGHQLGGSNTVPVPYSIVNHLDEAIAETIIQQGPGPEVWATKELTIPH